MCSLAAQQHQEQIPNAAAVQRRKSSVQAIGGRKHCFSDLNLLDSIALSILDDQIIRFRRRYFLI